MPHAPLSWRSMALSPPCFVFHPIVSFSSPQYSQYCCRSTHNTLMFSSLNHPFFLQNPACHLLFWQRFPNMLLRCYPNVGQNVDSVYNAKIMLSRYVKCWMKCWPKCWLWHPGLIQKQSILKILHCLRTHWLWLHSPGGRMAYANIAEPPPLVVAQFRHPCFWQRILHIRSSENFSMWASNFLRKRERVVLWC